MINESRMIVNLIQTGQEALARKRILDGRQMLAPLEGQLATAMQDMQKLESTMIFTSQP